MNNYQIPDYFSLQQQEAILIDNTNVLVSAAAGCGKTTLLVERILRKIIRDQVALNKLIVVTFTEAAASELKERIESELNKVLKENQDNDFIKEQLNRLNDAYIMTFHALCLRLLKENQASFNYDDVLQPGSDLALNNLKYQAFLKLTNECFHEENYRSLNKYYSNIVDDQRFHNILEHIRKLVLSNASFEEFINYHQNTTYHDSLLKHANFKEVFKEYLYYNLNQIIDTLEVALSDSNNKEETVNLLEQSINEMKSFIKLIETEQYQALKEQILNFKVFTKPRKYKEYDDENIPLIRVYHNDIKETFNDRIKYFFINEDTINTILINNDSNALALLKYAQIYESNLKGLKKQTGLIEFDDFEQDALNLLYEDNKYSEVALQLQKHFNEILIDEYQDTNIVQEKIVSALANGSNTFMVGDLKQSIYRFRKATPQLFVEKYERYKVSDDGVVIDLSGNYRSKNEVLETTNFIFKSIFSKQVGGIDYDETNELKFQNLSLNEKYPDIYPTKFFFNLIDDDYTSVSLDEKEVLKEQLKRDNLYQNSARNIVSEINKLHKSGVNYNEICILVNNRKRSEFLIDYLQISQIPYMFHTNSGFFETYEIKDLTNLLRTLINPNDDICLLGSLHSFFFNLDENDLLNISLEDGYSFYHKLKNSKYHSAINLLEKLINYASKNHPLNIINYLYQETSYLSYLVNFKNYEQSLINITNFKSLINDNYDYYNSLEYLIEDIESGMNKSFDSVTPAVLSQKDDVINIMSIHKSKGLEFNYVFLFDDSSIMKKEMNTTGIDFYKNQLILPYFDSHLKIKADNPLKKLKQFLEEKEIISEKLRVLYVALTRAKVQLYLFTNIKKSLLEKNILSLQTSDDWLIKESVILNQKTLMDYVTISLLRHRDGLLLRDSHNIDTLEEVYTYNDQIASLAKYDDNVAITNSSKPHRNDDFKVVVPKVLSQKQIETITPSKHYVKPLDFDQINEFDTYRQGSNVHIVLELVDFKNPSNLEILFSQYEISKQNQKGIIAFLNSDFFKTTIINSEYFKEYAFNYLKDNKLVNGVIDLYVEDDEYIYVIDYKSDNLSLDELKEYYTSQLQVYYDVINNISEKKIICYIYSLYHQEFIKLT